MPRRIYRRNLPHIFPEHTAIFLTWRLYGSLPPRVQLPIRKTPGLTDGEKFVRIDRMLDRANRGPLWLQQPGIAEELCRVIEYGSESGLKRFALHEYVVMPNHVHLLLTPYDEVAKITRAIKGTSAREANLQLGRVGQVFWQDESYDHYCRNADEFGNISEYIAMNPVRAGLAATPEKWPWSSAHRRKLLLRPKQWLNPPLTGT
jgi:type I restriction enzyme R subunit/putative DNA methylase